MHILNLADKNPARLLASLRGILSGADSSLQIDLTGPGSLMPDTALMIFHELRARPSSLRVHIHSHTCLFDGSILVWLAGNTRSIRPDAWIQVSSISSFSRQKRATNRDYPGAVPAEEPAHETDLRSIMVHMDEYIPVAEIAGLRVFPKDLHDLGILDVVGDPDPLAQIFNATHNPPPPADSSKKTRRLRSKKGGSGAA
jgi:hypothetical protein